MTDERSTFLKHAAFPGFERQMRRMETALGLPEGFAQGLLKEDDWSFIIKLHALLEASITMILVEHLGGADALRKVGKLESLLMRTKLTLGYSLGLFSDADRLFLDSLSELRNGLVHRIKSVNFSLADADRANIARWVVPPPSPKVPAAWKNAGKALVLKDPKLGIWFRAFLLICYWKLGIDELRIERGHPEGDLSEARDNINQITKDLEEVARQMQAGMAKQVQAEAPPSA